MSIYIFLDPDSIFRTILLQGPVYTLPFSKIIFLLPSLYSTPVALPYVYSREQSSEHLSLSS